jgi:hypothetical protein
MGMDSRRHNRARSWGQIGVFEKIEHHVRVDGVRQVFGSIVHHQRHRLVDGDQGDVKLIFAVLLDSPDLAFAPAALLEHDYFKRLIITAGIFFVVHVGMSCLFAVGNMNAHLLIGHSVMTDTTETHRGQGNLYGANDGLNESNRA